MSGPTPKREGEDSPWSRGGIVTLGREPCVAALDVGALGIPTGSVCRKDPGMTDAALAHASTPSPAPTRTPSSDNSLPRGWLGRDVSRGTQLYLPCFASLPARWNALALSSQWGQEGWGSRTEYGA